MAAILSGGDELHNQEYIKPVHIYPQTFHHMPELDQCILHVIRLAGFKHIIVCLGTIP